MKMTKKQPSSTSKALQRYKRADAAMGDQHEAYRAIIETFPTLKGKCLQVGFRDKPYGPNWDVLDLYDDSKEVNIKADIMNTKLPDEIYDVIVASAILEHVPYPQDAADEMFRMLKPGGLVFIAVPFNQPYHPSPMDFFRFSPEGILVIMERFEEIKSGYFRIDDCYIYNGVFFWGRKPKDLTKTKQT